MLIPSYKVRAVRRWQANGTAVEKGRYKRRERANTRKREVKGGWTLREQWPLKRPLSWKSE